MSLHSDRVAVLTSLRERWGSAAPRPATEVFGALAAAPRPGIENPGTPPGNGSGAPMIPAPATGRPLLVPLTGPGPASATRPAPATRPGLDVRDGFLPTGFPELDALLAPGGLPRAGTVALAGAGSSGVTTLALRAVAAAQDAGCLAAWVDLSRSLDPVEAVARGVRLEWLAILVPDETGEALAMAGSLLQARAVDVIVLDLAGNQESRPSVGGHEPRPPAGRPGPADQLGRLAAFARRTGALLMILLPSGAPAALRAAVEEVAGLRLELRRRGWIRLGREVVGQLAEARVARDRHGALDRRTRLRILYAEGGARDRCLGVPELLVEEEASAHDTAAAAPVLRAAPTRAGIARASMPVRAAPDSPASGQAGAARAAHGPPEDRAPTDRVAVPVTSRRNGSSPGPAIHRGTHRPSHAPAPPFLATPRHPARPAALLRRARHRTRGPRRAAVG